MYTNPAPHTSGGWSAGAKFTEIFVTDADR